jgi:hypothetical protein
MQAVIGYPFRHSASVLYGFACLFVLGFLWAAIGGAGSALPAFLSAEKLGEFFAPLIAVFAAWTLKTWWWTLVADPVGVSAYQPAVLVRYGLGSGIGGHVAVLVLALVRRRFDSASSLILHMAIGWWIDPGPRQFARLAHDAPTR